MDSPPPSSESLTDRIAASRDFAISFVIHLVIVLIFGTTVLIQAVKEPEEFVGDLAFSDTSPHRPPADPSEPSLAPAFDPLDSISIDRSPTINPILTPNPSAPQFLPPSPGRSIVEPRNPTDTPQDSKLENPVVGVDQLPREILQQIGEFAEGWVKDGAGTRQPEYEFTAFLGQYSGGNWQSTVRVVGDRIEAGSLPNLLYLMSHWSNDRIKTNYRNVRAIRLDSDELFSAKPPFIFLTGTRDFRLTEREVENLQKYIRNGGCIWGDASIPGLRSRFDIAFRREMKRVIPDIDKNFEPLPGNHPIFTKGYYKKIQSVPPGINYYAEPVEVLRFGGEIAVLYTANDYGDMWQIGLDRDGEIDLARDERGRFVAINDVLYSNRGTYVRNLEPEAIRASFEFGTNVVIHLLTRWQSKLRSSGTL